MAYVINDRRSSALGGQSRDRSRSAITTIAWHYSAVARSVRKFITGHEEYWKNTLGWDRGGYHFYIDADANIWQNYDYERITWGVYNNNGYVVHISVEAGNGNDYSPEQVAARDWLTRKIMADLNIPASKVKGHNEIYNNSSCPGYTKAQMDAFRAKLAQSAEVAQVAAAAKTRVPVSYNKMVAHGGYSIDSKPWGEPGLVNWGKTDDIIGNTITVYEENGSGEYANGVKVGWIDKRALIDVPARVAVSYNVIIKTGGYSIDSRPWGEPGFANWGTTDAFVGKTVPVIEENVSGEYINTSLGWIDKRAVTKEPVVVSSRLILPAGQMWITYPENGPYKAGKVIAIEEACSYRVIGDKGQGLIVVDLEGDIGRVAIRYDESKGATIEKQYA